MMTGQLSVLKRLMQRDIDDVLDYARRLSGRERTSVFHEALSLLTRTGDDRERITVLRFLQTLVAAVPNGRLPASAGVPAAMQLSEVVMSSDEHIEAKRAALDTLALVFLKAKDLTPLADSRVRKAFVAASHNADSQLRDFARTSLSNGGVLGRRSISSRQKERVIARRMTTAGSAALVAKATATLAKRRIRSATKRSRRHESQTRSH